MTALKMLFNWILKLTENILEKFLFKLFKTSGK